MKGMLLESGASGSLHMTFSDEVIRKAVYQPLPATFSIAGEPYSNHKIFTGRHLWSYASHAVPFHHYAPECNFVEAAGGCRQDMGLTEGQLRHSLTPCTD